MKSDYPLQHKFAGILLCALGILVLCGWALGNDVIIRVIPGGPAVAINTALMFTLSGLCLLSTAKSTVAKNLYLISAIILVVLPLAIFSQYIFQVDLGIDLTDLHASVGSSNLYPGRTAAGACIGFICSGLIFILNRNRQTAIGYRRISLLLAGLTVAIGVLALLGYILQLEYMYHLATYNRMATMTALGLSILGIGTWSFSNTATSAFPDTAINQSHRIVRLAATLLTVFAVTAGLTGFAILRHGFEASSKENLLNVARTTASIISSEIDKGLLISRSIANRVSLRELLTNLDNHPADADTIADLRTAGKNLIDSGFSRIEVKNAKHMHIFTLEIASQHETDSTEENFTIPVNAERKAHLTWREGFVLIHKQEVIRDGRFLGEVVTHFPLTELTNVVSEAQTIGMSNDLVLCGNTADELLCFPGRFDKNAVRHEQSSERKRLDYPVTKALAGATGTATTTDSRNVLVQAAFAPIPDYPLGVMVKKDVVELYAALRERLNLLVVALLVFIGAGTLLIRSWIRPLVEQIVTEQRRIEAILNNSNDAFIAVDSSGTISDWNLQAEKTLGWSAAEAIKQKLSELIIPQHLLETQNNFFERFLANKVGQVNSQRMETEVVHKYGYVIAAELSIASFDNGKDFGASIFMRDLTEVKAAELTAIQHAQELEAARAALVQSQKLEAVGKLTGGVAHDFNNVLQVVQGSLQLLQLENSDKDTAEKRIATAMAAVDRGAKLSAQLLAFARKQPLRPKVKNLATIINGMSDMLRRVLGDAIEIQIITSDRPWNTLIDPNQLENVILNLTINARDAMHGAGKLTIEVSNCVLNDDYVKAEPGLHAGDFVMLSISDTGSGIPADVIDHVFEPFFTTKPEGEGTGLGLSMAHGFVKQSGGHIRIFSDFGQGTTLRIYLPRSFEQELKDLPHASGEAYGGKETVLVVEDDLAVQATVVDIVAGLGYKVLKASNAEAALKLIKKNKAIDLLFTDVVMPGTMRSPELARQAKQLIPNLSVLFTSGYTRNAIESGGRLDPGVHLLSKPYGREQLARKFREVLEEKTKGAPHINGLGADAASNGNLSIAFVEDNDDSRIAVTKMLELMGYRVTSFNSAEAALPQISTEAFDVLITDVSLPDMSGIELANILRTSGANIRIIFASGYTEDISKKVAGEFQLLPKPFTISQLIACLTLND